MSKTVSGYVPRQSTSSPYAPSRLLGALRRYLLKAEPRTGPADWLEKWYLGIALWVMVTAWISLTLGELAVFSLPLLLVIELGAVAVLVRISRPVQLKQLLPTRLPEPSDALFLLVLLLAAALYLRPSEFILGMWDPGVYVITGANIARTGSITMYDREFLALPANLRQAFFYDPSRPQMFGRRLEGFYIFDADRGMVSPHGFHLFPSLLAVGYSLAGIRAELMVTPLLALLSILGLYLLTRRLFGAPTALVAALLLTTNLAQVWFARYHAAEVMVQFLLFAGFLALTLMLDTGAPRFGLEAGLLLGAVHLAKAENFFLPVVLVGFLIYELRGRQFGRQHWWLVGAYAALSLQAVIHARLFAPIYSADMLGAGIGAIGRLGVFPAVAAVGIVLLVLPYVVRASRAKRVDRGRLRSAVRVALVLGVCALAVYAYYVRPMGTLTSVPVESLSSHVAYDVANRQSFIRLGWYVTPLGLLIGVLGLAMMAGGAANRRNAVLVVVAVIDTIWYLYDAKITPVHFWTARRWLPLVVPGFVLFGSYFLVWLGARLRWRWPAAVVPAGFGFVVLISSISANAPFVRHTEYRGAVEQVGALAAQFPENSAVLFDEDDVGLRLAGPLQLIWGRPSFVVWKDSQARSAVGQAVAYWRQQGRQVYWVRSEKSGDTQPSGLQLVRMSSVLIDLPEALVTQNRRPSAIGEFRVPIRVYQVLPES